MKGMRKKRKFFQFQNVSRGSQPSTENPHPWQKARLVTSKSRWVRQTHPTGHGSSSSGCHHGGRRWDPAGRVAPPGHPPGDIGPFARRGSATAQQRGGFALGLRFAGRHGTHTASPRLPRLHRVKTRALIVQLKPCILKKLLTRLVHISTLRRNVTLFSPLDPPSDPCHPPLQDTRRSLLRRPRGGQPPAGLPSGAAGTRRGCSPPRALHGAALLPRCEAAGAPLCPPRQAPQRAEGTEPPPADSAVLARYPSSAKRSQINQRFGLVFDYYGQYIKGIYLRSCLSCQSFPMSSILNTPYNY